MAEKTALVVGASRGLGLGLARELDARGWRVIATRRSPASDKGLQDLADNGSGRVRIETLDMEDSAAIEGFASRLDGQTLDLLFVNAGISGPHGRVGDAPRAEVAQLFMTNVVAPIHLAEGREDRLARLLGFTAALDLGSALVGAAVATMGVAIAAPLLGWSQGEQHRAALFGAALLLSIAAASIVTRVSSPLDLGGQISSQFGSAKAWTPVAAILTILGVLPGMPHVVILPAAAACAYIAWKLRGADALRKAEAELAAKAPPPAPANPSAIGWNEVSDDAPLGLEIGYGLVSLVDERKGAPLMARITGIRRQLSKELGFVIPLMFLIGGIFALLWGTAYVLGRKIERERAAAYAAFAAGSAEG